MNVVVTGATGFVGAKMVARLLEDGYTVRATVRSESSSLPAAVKQFVVGDITPLTDWREALLGAEIVVHLAARVHMMRDAAADPLSEFRRVNSLGTLNLARQAAQSGARRFVFLSSVKAIDELGDDSGCVVPPSQNAYGLSKREAELGLCSLSNETGMEVVIVRAPLVYGAGVKANFRTLMRAVERGIPLPLGAVHNRRSLVALGNLVDFIATCMVHPAAANETFAVSDGEDLSTTQLIRRLASAMGRPARLIPVPAPLLRAVAAMVGQKEVAERLLGSLHVDISKARELLGWRPPLSVDEGLRRAAAPRA